MLAISCLRRLLIMQLLTKPSPLVPNRLKINIEGCVNNLDMECMRFYHKYGKDGRNYTARAVFPCYYDPTDSDFVVVNFDPDQTLVLLILFVTIPFGEFCYRLA